MSRLKQPLLELFAPVNRPSRSRKVRFPIVSHGEAAQLTAINGWLARFEGVEGLGNDFLPCHSRR